MGSPKHTPEGRVRFAQRMRERRVELGLSQPELASRVGLARPFLTLVENGRNNVSIANAARIAGALGLALHEMIAPPAEGARRESSS